MTIDPHTLLLVGIFIYFAIGATQAFGVALMAGFTGRFEWPLMAALFFGWPIMWLLRSGLIMAALFALAAATSATAIAYILLRAFI